MFFKLLDGLLFLLFVVVFGAKMGGRAEKGRGERKKWVWVVGATAQLDENARLRIWEDFFKGYRACNTYRSVGTHRGKCRLGGFQWRRDEVKVEVGGDPRDASRPVPEYKVLE